MFKLLIDTCVWIDLAKKYQDRDLLDALETLVKKGQVSLILPRTIVDEFARNKQRTIEAGRQSISDALKRVKEVVLSFADGRKKAVVIEQFAFNSWGITQQIVECRAWDRAPPRFLIRDSRVGASFDRRERGLGIRQVRTPFRSCDLSVWIILLSSAKPTCVEFYRVRHLLQSLASAPLAGPSSSMRRGDVASAASLSRDRRGTCARGLHHICRAAA